MSDQSDGAIKNLGIFSTLQAATDQKFFLLAASFSLLIDSALVFFHQPGLMVLARDKSAFSESNVAFQAILIFIAFSFLTSIVLPLAAAIFDQIYLLTVGRWVANIDYYLDRKLGLDSKGMRGEENYVRPWKLRDEAHRSMEKYYLDLYSEYQEQWYARREDMLRFALYAFFCLVMLGLNFYLGSTGHSTAATVIAEYFGSVVPIWISLCALLIMTVWRFISHSDKEWVYCPNLYDKLKDNPGSGSGVPALAVVRPHGIRAPLSNNE